MASELDDTDRAILAIVQDDARATLDEIGAAVALSPAAVQRRLNRHRQQGVITSTQTVLDPHAAGAPILVLTLVTLERDSGGAEVELDQKLRDHPNVQQAYELAGSFDRAVVFVASDMETYRSITRELFDAEPNVQRFASHVAMGTLKRTLKLPISSEL